MSDVHSTYPVAVRWTGEKRGLGSSPDGLPDLEVASPPGFGGPAGVWSPEHLFVLSTTTCWMSTFLAMAQASGLEILAVECSGEGVLDKGEDRRFRISRIALKPGVTIVREEDRERAGRLIEKAEAACLIRNSIRSEVTLASEVRVETPALVGPGR
jgi:peroxiredoxin-like protein